MPEVKIQQSLIFFPLQENTQTKPQTVLQIGKCRKDHLRCTVAI